jgi:GTP-binding protein
MIDAYLSHRKNLLGLILLVDIRRDPGKEEFEMVNWLESHGMPFLVVLTKADKLSKTKQEKRLVTISSGMNREKDRFILFSTKTKKGRDTVLEEIQNLTGRNDDE